VINLGDISLSEFGDQNLTEGDTFSVEVKSNLRAAYFTDDSELFDIKSDGKIKFKAKEPGKYPVAIIAKSEEGFEYNVVTFLIK